MSINKLVSAFGIMSSDETFVGVLALLLVVLLSLGLHEWAHAFVAYKNGDNTAKTMGRLTMNPLKHVDILGFFALIFVGFGFAKPVPIDSNKFTHKKKGVVLTSVAGVTVNLIIGLICGFLGVVIQKIFYDTSAYDSYGFEFLYKFFMYASLINFVLLFFNLLPIYPLDGFRVIEGCTKYGNGYVKWMRNYGGFILIGLIVLGMLVSVLKLPYYYDPINFYLTNTADKLNTELNSFWINLFFNS